MPNVKMPLSIVNWNILYEMDRPSDASRFDWKGKPTLVEQKAATAALAYFCYHDNVSPSDSNDSIIPSDRQLVKQKIKGKEYAYYRGGSNTSVRMEKVKLNIQALAERADIVCLQEVTPKFANELKQTMIATHQAFYSYQTGNNHGVMMLVKKNIEVIDSTEVTIQNADLARKVRVVCVRDPQTEAVIRLAVAHLFGHHKGQAADKEASDLFDKIKKLPGRFDAVVVAADVNETKRARESVVSPAIHYAKSSPEAGWQLHLVGREAASGQIPVQAKLHPFGLCAIMQDKTNPSDPMDLSDLPAGLSDHAPIGTQLSIEPPASTLIEAPIPKKQSPGPTPKVEIQKPLPQLPPAPKPMAAPQAINPSPFQFFFSFFSQLWEQIMGGLGRTWQWLISLFT